MMREPVLDSALWAAIGRPPHAKPLERLILRWLDDQAIGATFCRRYHRLRERRIDVRASTGTSLRREGVRRHPALEAGGWEIAAIAGAAGLSRPTINWLLAEDWNASSGFSDGGSVGRVVCGIGAV